MYYPLQAYVYRGCKISSLLRLASTAEFYQVAHTKQEYMEKGASRSKCCMVLNIISINSVICRHNPVFGALT